MNSLRRALRRIDTRFKLYLCFALLLGLGGCLAWWLLGQLSQMQALASHAIAHAGQAAARSAQQIRDNYELARLFAWLAIGANVTVASLMALWLRAEMARPMQEAVALAQRVGAGDLSTRIAETARGQAGLLMRTLQEMNDKLLAMILKVRGGTETIATGIAGIASGSQDLSARGAHQAAALKEAVSSIEQLAASVRQTGERARAASTVATSAIAALEAGATTQQVAAKVKEVAELINEMSSASTGQADGIEQARLAIAAVDQAARQNAALLDQSAAAAAAMRDQAGSLARAIGAFMLGPEHARPSPIHLVVSNRRPNTPPAAERRSRARIAVVPASSLLSQEADFKAS